MQTSDIAAQAIAILTPVVSGGASVAQGVATRVLGDLISQRLSRSQEGRAAWTGFRSSPQNDSLVRHLLRQEMDRDIAFRQQVEEQLRKTAIEVRDKPVQQSIGSRSSRNIQIGGSAMGDVVGRDKTTTHKTKKSQGGAIVGVVAIVVIVVLAIVVYGGVKVAGSLMKSARDEGLTASSSCQQFLNTDEDDERQALADIGISMGYSEYSDPLALPEIQYECGGDPTITLGALIQRDGSNV
jgi:hypothetical protein